MATNPFRHRGVDQREEQHEKTLTRDTRGKVAKGVAFLQVKNHLLVVLGLMGAACLYAPIVSTPCAVAGVALLFLGLRQHDECPLKMPIHAQTLDKNEFNPKDGSMGDTSAGIFYIGNDRGADKKQVWLTNSDCRQHFLILGTTGSGKTELLVGFGANALAWASGFLMVDGKGDVAVFAKIYALARRFGRTDDLLVLNFMEDDKSEGDAGKVPSNTLNPFSTGGADVLTQMVVSLMDESGGDGGMWKGRATAMFTGVMRAMVYLRNNGLLDLDVGAIRDFLNLRKIIDLNDESKFSDMPAAIRKSVSSYLTSLPGYQPEKGYKQAQTTLDQHGFLEMQFTRIMGSLADVYGHIFMTPYGEVDMFDVVLNRRILMVMLPALGKSKDEVANLGKIVVASLKRMMGATLGNQIEGSWLDVVDRRMTTSPSPFIVILDEVGYYCVEGMDLMAAQARSLGFSMTYAAQDINGMKSLNEKIVGSIIGNTNTKIIMRIEDKETAELAIELAGKAYKPMVLAKTADPGEGGLTYQDNPEARMEALDRISFRDMKGQKEGEMHIIHGDWVVRAKGLYANPVATLDKRKLKLRANHFIKVPKPKQEDLQDEVEAHEILEWMIDEEFAAEQDADIAQVREALASPTPAADQISQIAIAFAATRANRPAASSTEAMCAALAEAANAVRQTAAPLRQRLAGKPVAPVYDQYDHPERSSQAGRPAAPQRPLPPHSDPYARHGQPSAFRDEGQPPHSRDVDFGDDAFPSDARDRDGWAGAGNYDRDPTRERPGFDLGPFDDLDGPPPPRRQSPQRTRLLDELARSPRRPVHVRDDVEHELDVAGRPLGNEPGEDDAVFRVLADLDYSPETTTAKVVEERLERATGARSATAMEAAVPPSAIDAVAFEADAAMAPPSIEDAEDAPPPPPAGGHDMVSDFLSSLLDEDDDKGSR